jgi:putative membrane protein
MVADHQKAVAIFEVEAEKGSNKELQAFATKTLPTLKEHLKMARALNTGK